MVNRKTPNMTELDFDTDNLEVIEPLKQKAAVISHRLRVVRNPYTGNKRKIIPYIFDLIERKNYCMDRFLDLFCGSSFVGCAAKACGSTVFSNDLMLFPYYNARFLVENSGIRLTTNEMSKLLEPSDDRVTVVRDLYSDRFTYDEAKKLDCYRSNIDNMFDIEDEKYALALCQILHFVMDSCFVGGRLNKGQVLADREHRINHVKNSGNEMNFLTIPMYPHFYWDSFGSGHTAFNRDAIELLSSDDCPEVDICYIDPPYGGQQSDYSFMYSFFDDYIRKKPKESDENCKKFSKSSNYIEPFREMLSKTEKIPVIILSYNDSSWSSLDKIVGEIKRFRSNVSVEELEYDYNYRDQSKVSKEYLISAE